MGVTEFDDTNFESEVLKADVPVLVDFWAPWCGPCRMIAPMIDELARENTSGIKIGKLNVDNAQRTAIKYGIETIPTLMIFKAGEVVDRMGPQPKSRLQEAINAVKA
jgi:thioredoxin 1